MDTRNLSITITANLVSEAEGGLCALCSRSDTSSFTHSAGTLCAMAPKHFPLYTHDSFPRDPRVRPTSCTELQARE